MAEEKEKHGGARPNSGGTRENSGPKKSVTLIDIPETDDPEEFLASVMNDQKIDAKLRMDAARSLMPYRKKRTAAAVSSKGPGKKEERQARADEVAGGRFKPSVPPRLQVVNEK